MTRIIFKFIPVIVFVSIGLLSFRASADVGCLSSNTTYTYINEESNSVRNNHRTNNSYSQTDRDGHVSRTFYHREEYDRSLTASNFCIENVYPAVSCFIHATRPQYSSSPGTLVNYSTVNNCYLPLDDYLPFLLIAISGISIYFLRSRLAVI